MSPFAIRSVGPNTIHGQGGVGGKAEGLLALAAIDLPRPFLPLRSEILAYEIHERYADRGALDPGTLDLVEGLVRSFDTPVAVRPSEPCENDPEKPTSGGGVSYMLPNSHPDPAVRVRQFCRALQHIYDRFAARAGQGIPTTGVIVSPIHGIRSQSSVGDLYYPASSGVADSICTHPITGIESNVGFGFDHGFARVAFGHGYSTVRMDFDVVPVLGVVGHPRPTPLPVLQHFFYALDMQRNEDLAGHDMETMRGPLSLRHADPAAVELFGGVQGVNFKALVESDRFGYASGLRCILERIARHSSRPFQIEFTFNVVGDEGFFNVVQYKYLRDLRAERVRIPEDGIKALLDTDRVQGHGTIEAVAHAVIISPFNFDEARRDEIRASLRALNERHKAAGSRYVLVCPGKVGTTDAKLGFRFSFDDLDGAALIVEYGYDVCGAPSIEVDKQELTGGVFGSHFLYQILGGAKADQRIKQWKAFGSQGTHFLTNLIANRTIYAHIDPTTNFLDGWFFSPPDGQEASPIFSKRFDRPVTVYADIFDRRCLVK